MIDYTSFSSLSAPETAEIRAELFTEKKIYNRGDIIIHSDKRDSKIALLEKGSALFIRIDVDGHRNIMDYYEQSEIFGWFFYPIQNEDTMYVSAKEDCVVNIIDYIRFFQLTAKKESYAHFFERMAACVFAKSQIHANILSQRSIRGKLVTYFEYIRNKKNSDKFTLPLTLSDLADYIAVDRSAMSREIKKLNEDGVIESSGNSIIIKKNGYGE